MTSKSQFWGDFETELAKKNRCCFLPNVLFFVGRRSSGAQSRCRPLRKRDAGLQHAGRLNRHMASNMLSVAEAQDSHYV